MSSNQNHLAWIDLEMTGLNDECEKIIEIACIITDTNLNILAESPAIAIHQPNSLLNRMDDWNKQQHRQSGLLEQVKISSIDEKTAENTILHFLKQWIDPGKSPLCGNSIHVDRRFLTRYMPELASYFHYRNLDVSSIKILAQNWAPQIAAGFTKVSTHTALQDIRDSIQELRYYRQHLFNHNLT